MAINILLAAAMWFVGILLYSIGIMQILLTLFCAIPLTKRLSMIYLVDAAGIYKRCAFTVVLWLAISAAVIFLVMYFGNIYAKCGFWVGVAISFLLSLGKWGMNKSNVADYFRAYARFYPPKVLDEIFAAK